MWQTSDLHTSPPSRQVTSVGTFELTCATGAAGATLPQARMIRLDTGERVTTRTPTIDGSGIITLVHSGFERGVTYEVTWNWTVSPTNKPSRLTIYVCVA